MAVDGTDAASPASAPQRLDDDAPLRPLDLLLFRGLDPTTAAVGLTNLTDASGYSHAAVVVTRDVLDLPFLDPGRIYALESVIDPSSAGGFGGGGAGGAAGGGGEGRVSLQIRDLELLAVAYGEAGGGIQWSRFERERPSDQELSRILEEIYHRVGHVQANQGTDLDRFARMVLPAFRTVDMLLVAPGHALVKTMWGGKKKDGKEKEKEKEHEREGGGHTPPKARPGRRNYVYTSDVCSIVYDAVGAKGRTVPPSESNAGSHGVTSPSDILADETLKFAPPVPLAPGGGDENDLDGGSGEAEEATQQVRLSRRVRSARARNFRRECILERLREHGHEKVVRSDPASEDAGSDDEGVQVELGDITEEEREAADKCIKAKGDILGSRQGRIAPFGMAGEGAAPASADETSPPPMNVAILVCGTRGDVQPFIVIGRQLSRDGHRVRLATHACFRDFVESNGLEFYPLAGDPKDMIGYMVKTGGHLVTANPKILLQDAPKARKMTGEVIQSTWGACTAKDPDRPDLASFTADAVISNPVIFGHYHVAEALQVPLHMIFTMPWTPTRSFPHAMACRDFRKKDILENYLSYTAVDTLYWAAFESIIDNFRKHTLGLEPIPPANGPGLLNDNLVPFTYLWSPSLVPTPTDWNYNIEVADFIFFEQKDEYDPPADLMSFLDSGEPPVYVGFGSVAVQNPDELTRTIFDALKLAGKRGIVSAGWGGLGLEDEQKTPDHVYLIGSCPHDWLFPRMSAVCCHGGAGTVATALRCDRPVVVVPFFGDQPFWGAMIERSRAGPEPVPIRKLTTERLADAFAECDNPDVRKKVSEIGASLRSRDGARLAVESFYRNLPTTARGTLTHLGYSPKERIRVMKGDIVTRRLEHELTSSIHFSVAAKVEKPMEDVYAQWVKGAFVPKGATSIASGALGDREATLSDFDGIDYTIEDMAEVVALLESKPDGPFNLSRDEMDRFRKVRQQYRSNGLDTLRAANETLRNILLERHAAYRKGGINAIKPYAHTWCADTKPGEELREVLTSDSTLMRNMGEIVCAINDYPKKSGADMHSAFFWEKFRFEGNIAIALVHNMSILCTGMGIVVSRCFYVTRGVDAAQINGGLMPMGDSTLVFFANRLVKKKIEGPLNKALRDRQRARLKERTKHIIENLRSCGQ